MKYSIIFVVVLSVCGVHSPHKKIKVERNDRILRYRNYTENICIPDTLFSDSICYILEENYDKKIAVENGYLLPLLEKAPLLLYEILSTSVENEGDDSSMRVANRSFIRISEKTQSFYYMGKYPLRNDVNSYVCLRTEKNCGLSSLCFSQDVFAVNIKGNQLRSIIFLGGFFSGEDRIIRYIEANGDIYYFWDIFTGYENNGIEKDGEIIFTEDTTIIKSYTKFGISQEGHIYLIP